MPMKILGDVKGREERFVTVHLDTEKVDHDGNPHPIYLQNFKYPGDLPEKKLLAQLRADAKEALAAIEPGGLVGAVLE